MEWWNLAAREGWYAEQAVENADRALNLAQVPGQHGAAVVLAILSVGDRLAELTEELRRQQPVSLARFGPG